MNFRQKMVPTERMLVVFGLIKLVLLVFFFSSFTQISPTLTAEKSDAGCNGRNLLDVLRETEKATYEKVIAEETGTLNAKSILWKIEKEDNKPSWLFGTMHLADPRIAVLPDDVQQAILQSDRIIIESIEALEPQAMNRALGTIANLVMLENGTLRDLVHDDLEDELETALQQRGMEMQLAERMQPWLVAIMVSLPVCEIQRRQRGENVLDSVLAKFAAANGRQLEGLETIAEQLRAMASVPAEYHIASLEETLASRSIANDMVETMIFAYKHERIGVVFPLMKAVMPKTGKNIGNAAFQEILIDNRNDTMFERSLPFLENGSSFIAVGALHLPGNRGLIELFRKAGYTVTSMR